MIAFESSIGDTFLLPSKVDVHNTRDCTEKIQNDKRRFASPSLEKTGPLQPSLLDPDLKRSCVLPVFTTRGFSAATSQTQRPICMVTFLWSRDGIAVVSNNIHPTHAGLYVYSIKGQV